MLFHLLESRLFCGCSFFDFLLFLSKTSGPRTHVYTYYVHKSRPFLAQFVVQFVVHRRRLRTSLLFCSFFRSGTPRREQSVSFSESGVTLLGEVMTRHDWVYDRSWWRRPIILLLAFFSRGTILHQSYIYPPSAAFCCDDVSKASQTFSAPRLQPRWPLL